MDSFGHFCRTPWIGDQPIARPLHTHYIRTEKYGYTSTPLAGNNHYFTLRFIRF